MKDISGQRFGRLTAIAPTGKKAGSVIIWRCVCDCGGDCEANGSSMRRGHKNSCGCLAREVNILAGKRAGTARITHGMSRTPICSTYRTMKDRCYNPRNHKYHRYGARGIVMCESWRDDPQTFFDWASAHGYSKGLTIDRIDNDGPYSPENCRWATAAVQNMNKNTTAYLTVGGVRKTVQDWAQERGLTAQCIATRKYRGWSDEQCLLPKGYRGVR